MKKLILGVATLMALTFTACEDNDDSDDVNYVVETFESITLDSNGLNHNDSISGNIEVDDFALTCTWSTSEWGTFWRGFAISNHTDLETRGYSNPYSAMSGSGASSSTNFVVAYGTSDSIKFNLPVDLESVMINNNTYAYYSMLEGDGIGKKFGGVDGTYEDFFVLTLNIYNASNALIGSEDFYLADFRGDADYIVKEWTKLDLDGYDNVSYITFGLESTDLSEYGFNTPAYFCLDNLEYEVE